MCGICGQFNFIDKQPASRDTIKKMTQTMAHRGPDDEGMYVAGPIGLGFRRLSIIDLESGHQPMSDQEESVWVVFNGEIYNFPELRKVLEGYGHTFKTKSDTEVIVHGYKQWGDNVLDHLNGIFGLAIWDEKKRQLMLARDRMGVKMLYFEIDSGSITFGSEIRPLLAGNNGRPEVDPESLNLFLRYRYTPSPLTIFKNVRKLAPGTRLIVRNSSFLIERWWDYKPVPFDPMPSVREAEEQLLELYRNAIKRQLISDVPVGLLLSGGLDSGLLLALMNENGNTSWPTFTVGYGESFRDDELTEAAQTAKLLGATNLSVELNRETFEKSLSKIISCIEEPIASSSIVPMYHVCECARQEVKVALMGQGPDELFGGYIRHIGVTYGHYWRSLPDWLRKWLKLTMQYLPRAEAVKRGLYSLDTEQRFNRYQHVFSILPGHVIDSLFRDGLLPDNPGDKIIDCWKELQSPMSNTDELGGLQFLEIRSSLPDELLMYADKLSMAHGLEVRVPFLDHEIVEYVERLSSSFKVRKGKRKWLHRKVCEHYLPKQIMRRRKIGFAAKVVDKWYQESLSGKMNAILLDHDSLMYNYLKPDNIEQLVHDHQNGYSDNHKILFSLIVFEEWLRQL